MSPFKERKPCKHKINQEIERGIIRLELRWFQPKKKDEFGDSEADNGTCVECVNHKKGRDKANNLYNFYKGLQVTRVNIPRPATYEELQQQIALRAPSSCGLAAVERPDGTLACAPYENGEVVVFREIRPLHETEDFDQRSGGEECDWEEQVYRNFLKTVESKSKFATNSMLSDLRTFASQNML